MDGSTPQLVGYWPFLLFVLAVFALVGVMLGLSHILGEKTKHKNPPLPFESGIKSQGSANLKMPAHFYLIAIFFVIFDLEAAFLYAWAVSVREVGWAGFIEVFVFINVLLAGLIYIWRLGALDWNPRKKPKLGKIKIDLHN